MTEEPKAPVTLPGFVKRRLFTPHHIALTAAWLLSTVSLSLILLQKSRNVAQFRLPSLTLQVVYVLTLVWYLIRTGPSLRGLPELPPVVLPRRRIGRLIPVIGFALLFVAEFLGQGILMPLMILAVIWILIVWRLEIGLPAVLLGLGVTTIAFLAGLSFYQNHAIRKTDFILLLVFVIPMFIAGSLLSRRTGLVGSQLHTGQVGKALVSFLWGCLLFIPLGLSNAVSSPVPWMTWVMRWWVPFSQPFFSGIVEEAWFRLFLVSLCYFLLRPAFNKRPAIALVCAVLFSGITFGLGHGGTLLENFLITGLLYGLPMAIVFARRDWEHAVGAHYMINMIPTLMVFLKT